jgi:hypothetical protein
MLYFPSIAAKRHYRRGPAFAGDKLMPAQAVLAYQLRRRAEAIID